MTKNDETPHDVVAVKHWPGQVKGETVWRVFTDFHFRDGGEINVDDAGPFPSVEAAQVCVDLATTEGVEEISDDLMRRARRAYLGRALK